MCKNNIQNYEGFAVWLEELLCKETNNEKFWNLKKETMGKGYLQLNNYFKEIEIEMTRFGFMSQLGFPKYYDNKKIIQTVKKLYGSKFDEFEFIVLYGSRKPKSDIDLFIVSNNKSRNFFNGWLDVFEVNKIQFNKWLNNMDIGVTDPLFSGTLIYGNENKYNQLKKQIEKTPINQKHIDFNLQQAKQQKSYLLHFNAKDKQKKDCLSYIKSFTNNAQLLSRGIKPLTLKNINKYTS